MPSAGTSRTAIVAVSRPGARLAARLSAAMPDAQLHLERRAAAGVDAEAQLYDLPLRPRLQSMFATHDSLVVFLPVGATVRLLAPVLGNKKQDPAVVCVDDAGRYAVSVLSGHVGGADRLAHMVAEAIGAQPIITSASDALNVAAIDLIGADHGWRIDASPTNLTRAAAAVVNGEPVALWLDPQCGAVWPANVPMSSNIVVVDNLSDAMAPDYAASLIVSDRVASFDPGAPRVVYRPPTLAVGVGCRRDVDADHISELLDETLAAHGLAKSSVAAIATIDIKADEPGIIALARSLDVPLEIFDGAQLNAVAEQSADSEAIDAQASRPTASKAQELLGVYGVSEPAAMLAAGAPGVIVPRAKSDRATVAVARIANPAG